MVDRLMGEDVAVSVDLDPDLRTTRVDLSQIEQVIINLAVNARAAMPQGGALLLRTANTVEDGMGPTGIKAGEYVALEVTDNGRGIDPEILPKLFEPFFTTQPRGEGTGLGLAAVYGIVEQAGGTVEASGEVGAGATFRVLLPATAEADA